MKYSRKKINAHIKTAYTYAGLSYAERLKVGALLLKEDRIISIGYNGTTSGSDNGCEYIDKNNKMVTKKSVVHAEMNVIAFAAKNGVSTEGCTMVVTDSPCYECSKLIIQSGVKSIIYDRPYRDVTAIDYLTNNNVAIIQVKDII